MALEGSYSADPLPGYEPFCEGLSATWCPQCCSFKLQALLTEKCLPKCDFS